MTWRNLPRGISTARSSPFATPDCGSCRQRNHKQSWQSFTEIALPMLVAPGFREVDVLRLKDAQRNSLVVDLMNNNDGEFAKERLQATVFAGTPCGHPVPGTRKGID